MYSSSEFCSQIVTEHLMNTDILLVSKFKIIGFNAIEILQKQTTTRGTTNKMFICAQDTKSSLTF